MFCAAEALSPCSLAACCASRPRFGCLRSALRPPVPNACQLVRAEQAPCRKQVPRDPDARVAPGLGRSAYQAPNQGTQAATFPERRFTSAARQFRLRGTSRLDLVSLHTVTPRSHALIAQSRVPDARARSERLRLDAPTLARLEDTRSSPRGAGLLRRVTTGGRSAG